MGAGISSSGNRVLALLQVATEVQLQAHRAGVKARPGVKQGLRTVRGSNSPQSPQPSGTSLSGPSPHLSGGLQQHQPLQGSSETEHVGGSKALVKARDPVLDRVQSRANMDIHFYPKLLSAWTAFIYLTTPGRVLVVF